MEVPEIFLDGGADIPMPIIEGTLETPASSMSIEGDFHIPFVIAIGDIMAKEYLAISGNFGIPMQRWAGDHTARWISAPSTTNELWTIISPE
jgi:hypothetical protein